MRQRQSAKALAGSRIYQKGQRYYYFSPTPVANPTTGKVAKWHSLCAVADGIATARALSLPIQQARATAGRGTGMKALVERYRDDTLAQRVKKRPPDPARAALFDRQNKEIGRICDKIGEAFADFAPDQVLPVDIAAFVDQWHGQRMAQVYRSRLMQFYKWAARRGYAITNPAREIAVEVPEARTVVITHQQFHQVRDALMVTTKGAKVPSGPMMRVYMDLSYLILHRTTDVRLLAWTDVDMGAGVISVKPGKTERSSGLKVLVPISDAIRTVLERAQGLRHPKALHVIHTARGRPYTASGVLTAWNRACRRAKVDGITPKDIRAMAATDAKAAGYSIEQLQVALVHTDAQMSEDYVKRRAAARSEVVLALPSRAEY